MTTLDIAPLNPTTRRELRELYAAMGRAALADILAYYQRAAAAAATPRRAAFCERQIGKVRDCIGATRGFGAPAQSGSGQHP